MRTVYITILFILIFSSINIHAQGNISPGVSQEDWTAIQNRVTDLFGATYFVSDIINVDSAVSNRIVADGAISNPYNTLESCYIFIAHETGEVTLGLHGVIGIYKAGTVIWNSGTSINSTSSISASITATRDLNNDGKVEIITSWYEGVKGDIEVLWIFTWDGLRGNLINDFDSENESVLISIATGFNYFDIDGNDVYEIIGEWYPDENAESMEKIEYSWNGSLYGKWPTSPQPLPSGFYPRNRIDATIKVKTSKIGDKFSYNYTLQSNPTSKQKINEFILCAQIDSVSNYRNPNEWVLGGVIGRAIGWIGLQGFEKYIEPGKSDSSFYFESYRLPAIASSLIRGDNGNWVDIYGNASEFTPEKWLDEAISNSYKVKTIGPADLPNPFVPLNFLDTLNSYTNQSYTLGWIKDQATADKYLGYFNSAKTNLQQNNFDTTRSTLQQVLQDVNVDSTNMLTSEAYALIHYNTEYLLEHLPTTPPPGCIVKLINSTGSLLTNGTLQYRDSTWKDAINNNNGTFTINTTLKKLGLRMTYEYGTQTKKNVAIGTDTIIFKTVNTQVQLRDSQGSSIDTGIVQYYAGAWRDFGTTSNGITTKELLPVRYTFRLTYNSASINKAQNIGTNAVVVFQTIPAKVQLQTSTGTPLDTGTVQYYSGGPNGVGWKDFGITSQGEVTKELLPRKYTFRIYYNNASDQKAQNIDSNAVVVFQTVNASVELRDSQNALLDTGTVQYYAAGSNGAGWKDFGITSNGVVQKELLPARYNFRMTYNSARKTKKQNLDSNTVVVFQTSNISVELRNSQGALIDTGIVQYYSSGWKNFGVTENGIVSKELLPVKYTFRMTYGYANNRKAQNTDSNAVVTFKTTNAVVQLRNSQGILIDTGIVQYNASGWKDFGTTVNGIASKELLPKNYTFRMTYAYASKNKQQDIGANSTVIFQTVNAIVQLLNSQGNSIDTGIVQYNAGGWKDFGTTTNGIAYKELLAKNYNFRMTYKSINNTKAQNLDSSNTVSFPTVLCNVRVTNSSGKLLDDAIVTYYKSGWKPFGTTINGITSSELLPANITFRVQYGSTRQQKAQDIRLNPDVEFSLP